MGRLETFAANAQPCAATMDHDAAQAILALFALPTGIEEVALTAAAGRVLAEPVIARIDSPRRDCAAMDGYAVRSVDLADTPLRIIGSRFAGARDAGRVAAGEAMRVMTGAPIPEGADRVIVAERSEQQGDHVLLHAAPGERAHIRLRGSDFQAGATLLPRGLKLDPFALVTAAAAHVAAVCAWRSPRVRILATGDEILAPGSAMDNPQSVPDSLSIALCAFARQWGGGDISAECVPDDPSAIRAAARAALAEADLLVIAGGASRGDRDHCRSALTAMGLELAFADLAIKPGKPVWFGRLGGLSVMGLPGNPTAALTVARLFLAPLLAGLSGRFPSSALDWRVASLAEPVPANGPREAFLCAAAEGGGVRLLARQSASGQALLAHTQFLIRRPANAPALAAGTPVSILALGH